MAIFAPASLAGPINHIPRIPTPMIPTVTAGCCGAAEVCELELTAPARTPTVERSMKLRRVVCMASPIHVRTHSVGASGDHLGRLGLHDDKPHELRSQASIPIHEIDPCRDSIDFGQRVTELITGIPSIADIAHARREIDV